MIGRLLVVSASTMVLASGALAETRADTKVERWTMGMELIHDWSLFHCPTTVSDRQWTFTLEGMQLRGDGPLGQTWTTTVAADGGFKIEFVGGHRDVTNTAEMSGNVRTRRIEIYVKQYECWYRLTPAPPY